MLIGAQIVEHIFGRDRSARMRDSAKATSPE